MSDINYNQEKFNKAVLSGEATWWQMELPSGEVIFGTSKTDMLGYSEKDFTSYKDFTKLLHEEDYERVMQDMRDHLEGRKELYETQYRIKKHDGDYLYFYDCGKVISRKEGKVVLMGFVWKIKEGVEIEKQMKDFREMILNGEMVLAEMVNEMREND